MIHLNELSRCLEYFEDKNYVQVDTETTGHFNHSNSILLLQLGDYNEQFVFTFADLSPEARDAITQKILLDKTKIKILQNAKFDIKFLWKHKMDINNVYDTLLAEIIINAGKKVPEGFYSLYSIVDRYCGHKLNKAVRGEINTYRILNDRVINYAAEDVKFLELVLHEQVKRLVDMQLANRDNLMDETTVLGLENRATFAFAMMEYSGLKLDTNKWDKVKIELTEKLYEQKTKLEQIVINDELFSDFVVTYQDLFTPAEERVSINWNSPIQKLPLLQKAVPQLKNTSEAEMSKYKYIPIVSEVLKYSKLNKLYSSFAVKMYDHINPTTKRVHTEFWQILNTGRVSSKNPNLQQIPSRTEIGKQMRKSFAPCYSNVA